MSEFNKQELLDNTKWSAEKVFELFDEDKGGTLDTSELAQALTATVGKRFDLTMATPYMEKYDSDASGTLNIEEFRLLVKDVRDDMAAKKKSMMGGAMDAKAKKKKKQEEKGVMEVREAALKRAMSAEVDIDTSSFLDLATKEQVESVFSIFKYIKKVHDETEDLWSTEAEPDEAIVEKIMYGTVFSVDDLGGGKHEIHSVCKAVLKFFEGCAPLMDYRVVKLCLNLPRTVEEYKKVINHEIWTKESKVLFFDMFDHWKWLCEKEETEYYRKTMKKFYEDNGLPEKIADIEDNLVKFKDREHQMLEKLAKKYEKPNPCQKETMPAGLLAASIGNTAMRKNEDGESGHVPLSALVDVVSFILDADNLIKLKAAFEEFEAAKPEPEEDWSAGTVFDKSDADGSGMLDITELAAALTCVLGKVVAQPEVDKLMKKFDTSGDGQLDKAEFEAFAADMAKKKKSGFSMKSAATKKKEAAEVEAKRKELTEKAEGGGEEAQGRLCAPCPAQHQQELGVSSSLHRKKIMRWIQDQKDGPKLYVAPTAAAPAAAKPKPKAKSGGDQNWGPAGCPVCTHSFDFRLGEGRYNKNTPDSKEVKDKCSDLYARLHGDAKLIDTGMFLGGAGYAEIDQFAFGGTTSIEVMVRYEDFDEERMRVFEFGNDDGNDRVWLYNANNNGVPRIGWRVERDSSGKGINSAKTYFDDADSRVFTHIVMTCKDSSMKLYKNGELAETVAWGHEPQFLTRDQHIIGALNYKDNVMSYLKGTMSFLRMWNEELSEDQVQLLYLTRSEKT
ncbi:hypothetical protein TL16_g07679 [Triparma laevis f. inornata]|uniref:EF-hand domain-containing protein n=1 Tax=Triparma laevis f. inornata TaxID=1714386 RepID=A0A9W7EHI0_9STRA|nr:hypothetical protein TL16_g07679 [Triparma laevis f. inornata]